MRIKSGVLSGVNRLTSLKVELSQNAKVRLRWFDFYNTHGCNARLTCDHFGISRQTPTSRGRYNPRHIASLEDRSRRPKRVRQPTYSPELVEAVLKLREQYPRWGKDKLVVLLQKDGYQTSASTVGRIIRRLKERGVLKEPIPNHPDLSGPESGSPDNIGTSLCYQEAERL